MNHAKRSGTMLFLPRLVRREKIPHGAAMYFQRSRWTWSWITLIFAALPLAPLVWLGLSWESVDLQLWQHLVQTQLFLLLWNTFRLVIGVFVGVTLVGTGLAWLMSRYEFPGRSIFEWALVLPFAIPAYVFAFIFIGTLDGASTPMANFRELTGLTIWPNVRNYWGVLASFICAYYPYVYLLARGAFQRQGQEIYEVAKTLGCNPVSLFFRVALPLVWPAVVAGASLAVMETLADFGTVAIFNFQTFTTAIYKSWFGFFSISTAAQLASFLVIVVLVWRFVESLLLNGRDAALEKTSRSRPLERVRLAPGLAWCFTIGAMLLLTFTFVMPLVRLLTWSLQAWSWPVFERFGQHFYHSLLLSFSGSLLIVLCSLYLAVAVRADRRPWVTGGVKIATIGYALPGSILAVGLMLVFSYFERQTQSVGLHWTLVGGLPVLFVAYMVRFMAVGFSGSTTAVAAIQPHLGEAAKVLGVPLYRRVANLYVPLITPGFAVAVLLVMVDILKEMPATLLLRPFGWDTLAVSIYSFTAEGDWALAAIPSLALVLIGLLPVYILVKRV